MLAAATSTWSNADSRMLADIGGISLVLLMGAIVVIAELTRELLKAQRAAKELRQTVEVDASVQDVQTQALRIIDELVQATRPEAS